MSLAESLASLAVSLGAAYGAAAVGVAFTRRSLPTWYATLKKPSWNPPDWVFGPVWSVLYAMMAIAAWLVWQKRDHPVAPVALTLYVLQLGLNAAWPVVFFGLHRPKAAMYELRGLWGALAAAIAATFRVDLAAGLLLLPYLAWTTFAAVLNRKIVDLNR
jgi:benzodiazapine receptor